MVFNATLKNISVISLR